MAVIIPKIEVKVEHFRDFCNQFNVQTDKIAGNDGYDIELIIEELNKIKDENWIVNFIDDRQDGYFKLQRIN
jgi:hypothetical protein